MIEELRNDDVAKMVGGKFKLVALIQRRWLQLMQGARPMVETKGLTEMEVILKEITEGKIKLEFPEEVLDADEGGN